MRSEQHCYAAHAGRIMKVNHAGEHGAVSIYAGQILVARHRASALVPELLEFKAHEERHRGIFGRELDRRGLARCRSYWLCAIGGYVLGLVSGLLGAQAIAATTVAVEQVVLRHLKLQLDELDDKDMDAVIAITAILKDEQQHHDQSAAHMGPAGIGSRVLGAVVSSATELVIWIGMRV
jgi:3-demethoxyubiquinol 3-hydroxylase